MSTRNASIVYVFPSAVIGVTVRPHDAHTVPATFSRTVSLDAFVGEVRQNSGHGVCYIVVRSPCVVDGFPSAS